MASDIGSTNDAIDGETASKRRRLGDEPAAEAFDLDELIAAVPPVLKPAEDPDESFAARQGDYLHTFFRSQTRDSDDVTPEAIASDLDKLAGGVSTFLSYYMIRKVWGETWVGNRWAAMAMHNLARHLKSTGRISERSKHFCLDRLLRYTEALARFPYEGARELQKLWESYYWEKREEAWPHLKKSKFTLEPGDHYTKVVKDKETGEGREVQVEIKDSDMIMTRGDINNLGGIVGIYIGIARVMGIVFRDRGAMSTRTHTIRGQEMRIYTGPNIEVAKKEAQFCLDQYRSGGCGNRSYASVRKDEFGGRMKVTKVAKDGWWMAEEGSYCGGAPVFVPLTAKVAKMGVPGMVFSGMRLALAGGIWRPIPAAESSDSVICYNIYPPDYHDWEG